MFVGGTALDERVVNLTTVHVYLQCSLPGFYDPCPGEEKSLRVRYLFHAVTHEIIIKDNESLRIPKQCKDEVTK